MPAHSLTLSRLTVEQRAELERRLWDRQERVCYLCETSCERLVRVTPVGPLPYS
jgi:hypothetical protein